jgi:DNA-damage-inducible protein J
LKAKEVVLMAQAMVNFRMDADLKKGMEQACKELGMSMTTAFTIFATKVTREKRIPFEVAADPFYSDENMNRLRRSIAQMEATGGTIHSVDADG